MRPFSLAGLAAALLATTAVPLSAQTFNRVASFETTANLPDDRRGTVSVSEIVAASDDGMLLAYTDGPQEGLGLVDIADPAAPKPAGFVALGGEPTSVKIVGGRALVGVVTSESKAAPSGHLAVVDLASKAVTGTCDLGGQPDSVAVSPDRSHLAVVIENERDEDVADGAIPQMPGGWLAVLPMADGAPDCAGMKRVSLSGLAAVAPDDPEPEFVAVNGRNEAVVTIQENNHIAIVDLATATVTAHFSAGAVDLAGIDTEKDGRIELTGSKSGVLREPDGVAWLDDDRFVTADEGDYEGGSRGFTVWRKDGTVLYEAGATLEHALIGLGHYNDKRNKKGVEIEGVETGTFGADRLIFVAAERASAVAVYRDTGSAPELLQILPSGIGPEGVLAIPSRGLLVTANETDLVEDGGVRAHVMIFARGEGEPAYPTIRSAMVDGLPIPFGALSGLSADRSQAGRLFAVTDSVFSGAPRILTIDASGLPATITAAVTVTRDGKPAEKLDLEGIATRADGSFWLASEGHTKNGLDNLLLRVSGTGEIEEEIALPADLAAGMTSNGYEGVAVTGEGEGEVVWLAVQREWADDPKGFVKLLAYKPADRSWSVVRYPLEPAAEGAWVGLSEIAAVGDDLVVIERDNQIGSAARLKALMRIPGASLKPVPLGSQDVPVVEKALLRDLLPELEATNGYVLDKVEGFAVDAAGTPFVVTDNDGTDDSSGETLFLRLDKTFSAR
jgi:hypothetical protein